MGWITQLRFLFRFRIYHHSHLKSSSEMCFNHSTTRKDGLPRPHFHDLDTDTVFWYDPRR